MKFGSFRSFDGLVEKTLGVKTVGNARTRNADLAADRRKRIDEPDNATTCRNRKRLLTPTILISDRSAQQLRRAGRAKLPCWLRSKLE